MLKCFCWFCGAVHRDGSGQSFCSGYVSWDRRRKPEEPIIFDLSFGSYKTADPCVDLSVRPAGTAEKESDSADQSRGG